MLSDDERELTDRLRLVLEHGAELFGARDVEAMLLLIDRVTSPRAVCDEFERLAREMRVSHVIFHKRRNVALLDCGRHGADAIATAKSLADAYEALKDGGG